LQGRRGEEGQVGHRRRRGDRRGAAGSRERSRLVVVVPPAREGRRGSEIFVVLRVPKSADVRAALGASLVDMVDRGSRDERLLSWGTKIGCLTDAQIKALVPGAKAEDGVVLVDGDARRLDGVPFFDAGARD